jgi:hypothetical protein
MTMPDMVPLFRETIQLLQDAMARLENELELLSKAEVIDQRSLERLAQVSADLDVQSDRLLAKMLEHKADPDLIARAEELVTYFEDTAERLAHLAQAGQT